MHWTGLLAKRFYAPDTMVVGDLSCTGCGYNLRGLSAAGRCPECSVGVIESLNRIKHPEQVAAALRTLSWSYAAWCSLLLLPVANGFGSVGLRWLSLLLLGTGVLFRTLAVAELRYRCQLQFLPRTGRRVALLWPVVVAELICCLASLILLFVMTNPAINPAGPPPWLVTCFGAAVLGWIAGSVAVMIAVGWFGTALADLLGLGFIEREFAIGRWLLLAAMLFLVSMVAVTTLTVTAVVGWLLLAGSVVLATVATGFSTVALAHLAGGAERERDIREEVLGGEPTAAGFPRPVKQELPPIELAGGSSDRGGDIRE